MENTEKNDNPNKNFELPDEFEKIISDICSDITTSFPEMETNVKSLYIEENNELKLDSVRIFNHCKEVLPERFFDILYQKEDIFLKDSQENVEFLPNIDFKVIWNLPDVSDNSKAVLWKYLQLLLFCITGKIDKESNFGDAAKIFEAINEKDFKDKLEETMENIHDMFNSETDASNNERSMPNFENLPKPDDLHSHLSSMLNGKIGQLATEIAEEAAKDFQNDISGSDANMDDVLKNVMKNPTKIMNLVKSVGSKLDSKIKSGEVKESELMEEAKDLMDKMKSVPGMENMEKMFGKMMPGMGGKKGKFNMGAFQNEMNKNMKHAKTKERILRKIEEKNKQRMVEEALKAAMTVTKEQQELTEENLNNLIKEIEDEEVKEKSNVQNKKKKKKKKQKK